MQLFLSVAMKMFLFLFLLHVAFLQDLCHSAPTSHHHCQEREFLFARGLKLKTGATASISPSSKGSQCNAISGGCDPEHPVCVVHSIKSFTTAMFIPENNFDAAYMTNLTGYKRPADVGNHCVRCLGKKKDQNDRAPGCVTGEQCYLGKMEMGPDRIGDNCRRIAN